MSSDEGLFVQELVQHVAVRVDETDSSASELAGNYILMFIAVEAFPVVAKAKLNRV